MNITISKKDVIWGYFSQFFLIASGILTLPLILKTLTKEEIGLNYLLITFGSLVSLFDFGFAAQFGRNISYIFGGVQSLKKEGIDFIDSPKEVNYRLLATMIATARFVYRRIAFMVLVLMLSFGSLYVYKVTNGFNTVQNTLIIWIIFSFSIFFEMYYSYYSALLVGKGMIMESRKALVYSRVIQVVLTFMLLYFGFGLIGVVISNFISPFFSRIISHYYFFTLELRNKINSFVISKEDKLNLFNTVWHNAKKLGLVFVGAYAINKFSLFIAGLYLPLSEIASYGLMIQFVNLISTISLTFFSINQSRFSILRVNNQKTKLLNEFAYSLNIFYILFVCGALFLIFICPWLLSAIGANVKLPSLFVMSIFVVIVLLEGNHSSFAGLIITKNDVPFVKSSLIAGIAIILGDYFSLEFTNLGILGLVIVQGVCQLAYANWKWPHEVCKEFDINFHLFLKIGIRETFLKFKKI